MNLSGVTDWLSGQSNGLAIVSDDMAVVRGLLLKQATTPDMTVAVVWAGAPVYFSERKAVDLLGKNDPVIAKGPPAVPYFHPGHTKWNYDYSIGKLKPDVISGLWNPTANDRRKISEWGYINCGGDTYVLNSNTNKVKIEYLRQIH
jgi:hypothetical protein